MANARYVPLAQYMFAFQLGGAAFTHVVAEKRGALGTVFPGVFLAISVAVQTLHGADPYTAAVLHCVLAALGFSSGYIIVALGASPAEKRER